MSQTGRQYSHKMVIPVAYILSGNYRVEIVSSDTTVQCYK